MVGRLVQDEQVGRVDEGGSQGHALALAARERADLLAAVRHAEAGEHGAGLVLGHGAVGVRQVAEDLLKDGGVRVHVRVLGQIGYLHVREDVHGAAVRLLGPGQHAQKRGFARAVDADDAHLVPGIEIERSVLDETLHPIILFQMFGC